MDGVVDLRAPAVSTRVPSGRVARTASRAELRTRRFVLGALGVSVLSLVALRQPGYDPTAWLIWGRQLVHGSLDTVGGPSWKPLTVVVTTLFSLAGTTAASWLWLVVARWAGLLAVLLAYLVTRRLGSRRAAILAAAALALANDFLYNCVRGDSEGLLVALVLAAILAALDGRHRTGFALGVGAALLRPEVWPLVAAYGAWLLWTRPRATTALLVLGGGAAIVALWIGPELVGSGEALRAATRARNPVPGSPAESRFPFLTTFAVASTMLVWPVYAGAVYRVVAAWRARPRSANDRAVLLIGAGATVLMLTVAGLSEVGFTGNLRYSTLPAAGLCVLGGLGLPPVVEAVRGRSPRWLLWPVGALALAAPVVSLAIIVSGGLRLAHDEHVYGVELPHLIAVAGGASAVRACAPVWASPFERQAVAWRLRLPQRDVSTRPPVSGTVLASRHTRAGRATAVPLRAATADLVLRSVCRPR